MINPGTQGGLQWVFVATALYDSVPVHSLEFLGLIPLCTPLPTPHFPAPQVLQKFLTTCIKRKIIQPLDITLLSKQGLFFLLLIKEGDFLIWFLDGTLVVFRVSKMFSWGITLVLRGSRVSEAASVGVHAASLVFPRALLRAAWACPSLRGSRKTDD